MLISYHDITSRIHEEPKWYTFEGVPRYCDFTPQETGIYVKLAILVEISCQSCAKKFQVGCGYDKHYTTTEKASEEGKYYYTVKQHSIEDICNHFHYGDPPNHGCIGDTMNCYDDTILQAWEYETVVGESPKWPGINVVLEDHGWQRRTHLEGSLPEFGSDEWEKRRGYN